MWLRYSQQIKWLPKIKTKNQPRNRGIFLPLSFMGVREREFSKSSGSPTQTKMNPWIDESYQKKKKSSTYGEKTTKKKKKFSTRKIYQAWPPDGSGYRRGTLIGFRKMWSRGFRSSRKWKYLFGVLQNWRHLSNTEEK